MYNNLEAELRRKRITREMLADTLGVNIATVSKKLNTPDRMKLCEAVKIQETFFPGMDMNVLFRYDESQGQRVS